MRPITISLSIAVAVLLASCFPTRLVYIDDWEGIYTLREYNSCCDSATKVKMSVIRVSTDNYNWKLFFTDGSNRDTIFGRAVYEKKKLQFFVINTEMANRYFVDETSAGSPVFRIQYDNYYTKDDLMYIGHYTRWNIELKDYKAFNGLFAGTHYHFKKNNKDETLTIEKSTKNK